MLRPLLFGLLVALPLGACAVEVGGLGPVAAEVAPGGSSVTNPGQGSVSPGPGGAAGPGPVGSDQGSSTGGLPGGGAGMGGASEDAGGPWLPLDPIDAGVAPLPDAQPNGPLALTSPDFDEGDRLPSQFTCGGSNQSPALAWSGVPPGTQSLALVLSTPTNVLGSVVPFTRWAMWSIPASLLALPATLSPGMAPGEAPGANQVSNESDSFGGLLSDNAGQRYRGPCSRGFPQTFEFTLYALGAAPTYPSSWSQDVTTDDIAAWLETQAHVLARASLSGVSP